MVQFGGEGEAGRGSPAAAPLGEEGGREGVWVGPKPLRSVATREREREKDTQCGEGGDRGWDGGGILIYYGRDWLMLMCSPARSSSSLKLPFLVTISENISFFCLLPSDMEQGVA